MTAVLRSDLARIYTLRPISREKKVLTVTKRDVTNIPANTGISRETPRFPISGLWIPAIILGAIYPPGIGEPSVLLIEVVLMWGLVCPALTSEAGAGCVDFTDVHSTHVPAIFVVDVCGVVG